MTSSDNDQTADARRYVTADVYLKKAGVTLSGRTLRRWCAANPYLAQGLGEIPAKGKNLYDGDTAPRFREIWIDAERRKHAETDRLEREAEKRLASQDAEPTKDAKSKRSKKAPKDQSDPGSEAR